MKTLQSFFRSLLILAGCCLFVGCDGLNITLPPVFQPTLYKYAVDDGSNVPFTVTVYNSPTSVTCVIKTGSTITLTNSGTDQWSGTALYSSDFKNYSADPDSGVNSVSCTAINATGSSTTAVGTIELIPNSPPNIVIIQPMNICGNGGSRTYNDTLVDPSSTYLAGATYTLTKGTLPTGLGIDSSTGNLIGTLTAGDFSATSLAITATTVAGSTESSLFDINIYQATPCP